MYKKAFMDWNNKMKEINDEYKNRVSVYGNNSVKILYICKKCELYRITCYNMDILPLNKILRKCGIFKYSNLCIKCREDDVFIPYPINYQ